MVSSMSVKTFVWLMLVTPIPYAARLTKVLIVNVTIMLCQVMVLLLVYATMLKVYIIAITCQVIVVLYQRKWDAL